MIFNLMLFFPCLGIIFFILFGHYRMAGMMNICFSFLTFLASVGLGVNTVLSSGGSLLFWNNQFYVDAFSLCLIILTTFISFTVAIFSRQYMLNNLDENRINARMLQFYFIMYQAFTLTMLLVYTSNNIGILWISVEGATLATALLVSLYRTPESIEAAWKYFILCIVGIALALFGTLCVYFSAKNVSINISGAMLWTVLHQHAAILNSQLLMLAFIFLLVGYGTKIGLVPFHFWLPDAHSESPAPMSALLSGLLLNIGLYALVRFKMLIDPNLGTHLIGILMMAFGLISFLFAGFTIFRKRNIKRMFSYSSIEHMGLITFAFGLGGPLASFVGLFYMIIHSLVKSAIFMSLGNVIQLTKSKDMGEIKGLLQSYPSVGWTLLIGTIAIVGFPPFGIFNSEVMLVIATLKQYLFIVPIIIIGLLLSLGGIMYNLNPVFFGQSTDDVSSLKVCLFPIVLNLSIALYFGLHIPHGFMNYLNQATSLIAGRGILS